MENRWIPVTERMPRDGRFVLACAACEDMNIALHNGKRGWVIFGASENIRDDCEDEYRITAWMPLPEPYKEES